MTPDERCGTYAGYQAHRKRQEERCGPCKAAAAADRRRRVALDYLTRGQKLTVDATGTRRRINALRRLGWPLKELGERLGCSFQHVNALTSRAKVHRSTAAKVAALYDELCMLPGPSPSTAKRAAAKGWAPPLAWSEDSIDDPAARPSTGTRLARQQGVAFDDVAVERACAGDRVPLRPLERREAVRRLTAAGMSAEQIADRLGTTARTVQRRRALT